MLIKNDKRYLPRKGIPDLFKQRLVKMSSGSLSEEARDSLERAAVCNRQVGEQYLCS